MALPVSVFAQTPEMSAALRKAPFRAANARTGWLCWQVGENQSPVIPCYRPERADRAFECRS